MSANVSTVANKVVKLPYNGNERNRQGGVQVWNPEKGALAWLEGTKESDKLDVLYGYKQEHIFKDWDDVKVKANKRLDHVASL